MCPEAAESLDAVDPVAKNSLHLTKIAAVGDEHDSPDEKDEWRDCMERDLRYPGDEGRADWGC